MIQLRLWRRHLLTLLVSGVGCAAIVAISAPASAHLHDPMQPQSYLTQTVSADSHSAASETAPLNSIIITTTSKAAIFGTKRVHEGESHGKYRVKRIFPDHVEMSDGDATIKHHLFPTFTVSRGGK